MEKIASFQVNHHTLRRGIYVSRVDGDVVTYDLRMREPNHPPFLENAALHTLEHLFATFARNSAYRDAVVYFGPMGCRTGCYFLLRDSVPREEAVSLIRGIFQKIAAYTGEIPGAAPAECGNYREHDLPGAVREAQAFLDVIADWDASNLSY